MTDEEKAEAAKTKAEEKARIKEIRDAAQAEVDAEEEEERKEKTRTARRDRKVAEDIDWGQQINELEARIDGLAKTGEKTTGIPAWAFLLGGAAIIVVAVARFIAWRKEAARGE